MEKKGKKRGQTGKNVGSTRFPLADLLVLFPPMRSLVPGYLSFFIVRRAKRALLENDRVRD